jgi:low temperature requirement protein LtrA
MGLILGVVWAAHAAEPLWEHAARTLALMLVALPLLTVLLRRKQARAGRRMPKLRHFNILTAKVALVAVASGAEWLLGRTTDNADRIVAIGIVVVVAVVGPRISRFFVKQ